MSIFGLFVGHLCFGLRMVSLEHAKECALAIIDTRIKLFRILPHNSSI